MNGGRPILPLESDGNLSKIVKTGDELEIMLEKELIKNLTTKQEHKFKPFGPIKEIIEAGGLTNTI